MKKILVVDDDVDILSLVEMTLSMNNFDVKTTSRWQEIYDHIQDFDPDLILLDVSLGGADGRDICKKIKQSADTQDIPVILFSANIEMGDHIRDCQAQDFIAKPYELSHLLKTIRFHLN